MSSLTKNNFSIPIFFKKKFDFSYPEGFFFKAPVQTPADKSYNRNYNLAFEGLIVTGLAMIILCSEMLHIDVYFSIYILYIVFYIVYVKCYVKYVKYHVKYVKYFT